MSPPFKNMYTVMGKAIVLRARCPDWRLPLLVTQAWEKCFSINLNFCICKSGLLHRTIHSSSDFWKLSLIYTMVPRGRVATVQQNAHIVFPNLYTSLLRDGRTAQPLGDCMDGIEATLHRVLDQLY